MENYESNSYKSKEDSKKSQKKKLEKVVSGNVKKQEKRGLQKFADLFIAEDANDIKSYIFMDVVIPKIKETVVDVVKDGIDMIFYGKTTGNKNNSSTHRASYQRYYEEKNRDNNYIPQTRTAFDFDNVIIKDRADAQLVIDQMRDLLDQYDGFVSVSDFYDLVGVDDSNYVNNDWGWDNLNSASIIRLREGYQISLPRPKPLN